MSTPTRWILRGAGGLVLSLALCWTLQPTEEAPRGDAAASRTATQRPDATIPAPVAAAASEVVSSAPEDTPWRRSTDGYVPNQLMVVLEPGADADSVAAEHGGRVLSDPGRRTAVLDVASVGDVDGLMRALRADARVRSVGLNAVTAGASQGAQGSLRGFQWHLDEIDLPTSTGGLHEVVVAVLDTGIADVPSLDPVPFTDGWDFVNGDSDPLDDHRHGTHIASVIASDGSVMGVAPGVTLMPVKVLDQHNRGTEADLVEGIGWAVDNGADIINLSLTFGPNYVPSNALDEVLALARDAGVLVVGAAGNVMNMSSQYPAAHPDVLGVAASSLHGRPRYSAQGAGNDLMAPGGDLGLDFDGNGIPDGILAETIRLGQPHMPALTLMAGTSQAAAVVSGAAAHLVAEGFDAEEVRLRMQRGTPEDDPSLAFGGRGTGTLSVAGALDVSTSGGALPDVHLGLMPYFANLWGKTYTIVELVVTDGQGTAVQGAQVTVVVKNTRPDVEGRYAESSKRRCTTGWSGTCALRFSSKDHSVERMWWVEVQGVAFDGVNVSPKPMVYDSPAFSHLLEAMGGHPDLSEAPFAVAFGDGGQRVSGLRYTPTAGYSVVDLRPTGSMSAMMFSAPAVAGASFQDHTLAIPEGLATTRLVDMDGTGLASIPLGFRRFSFLMVSPSSGTGLASIPLGLSPGDVFLGRMLGSPTSTKWMSHTLGASQGSPMASALSSPLLGTNASALLAGVDWMEADADSDAASTGAELFLP